MTIFHGFMGKAGTRYKLAYGRPMMVTKEGGTDSQVTEMFRDICERMAWRR